MKFPSGDPEDLVELIRSHPLAWLVTIGEDGVDAVPLPLLPKTDEAGHLIALAGHCSRANAQVAALRKNSRAWALFMGPQGYISPGYVSQPQWAPTWNYAVAVLTLEVELLEAGAEHAVRQLIDAAEADRARPWRLEEVGDRGPEMLKRIIGFCARVTQADVRFKLGQDESLPTLREIITEFDGKDLAAWMHRLNRERLHTAD